MVKLAHFKNSNNQFPVYVFMLLLGALCVPVLPYGAGMPAQGERNFCRSQPPNFEPSLNCRSQTIDVMMRMKETEHAQIDF